jgi:hypothetical protein
MAQQLLVLGMEYGHVTRLTEVAPTPQQRGDCPWWKDEKRRAAVRVARVTAGSRAATRRAAANRWDGALSSRSSALGWDSRAEDGVLCLLDAVQLRRRVDVTQRGRIKVIQALARLALALAVVGALVVASSIIIVVKSG